MYIVLRRVLDYFSVTSKWGDTNQASNEKLSVVGIDAILLTISNLLNFCREVVVVQAQPQRVKCNTLVLAIDRAGW